MLRYLAIVLLCLPLLAGCMMPNVKEQRAKNEAKLLKEGMVALEVESAAPAFTTSTSTGGEFSVLDDTNERRIVLFFYPADDTPNTTRQLQQLSKPNPLLDAEGIRVYGLSGGSASQHLAYAERYDITLPLLADEGWHISASYGCALDKGSFVQRTMVGLEPDGTIAFFERGFPMGDPAKQILKWYGLEATE